MGKLSASKVSKLLEPGPYHDADGPMLTVTSKESKSWALRFRKDGRWRDLGTGSLKVVRPQATEALISELRATWKNVEDVTQRGATLASDAFPDAGEGRCRRLHVTDRAGCGAANAAVGLWLLNTAMVGGWTQLFFRERRLGASAAASGATVVTGAAYVAAAAKVDRPAAAAAVPFVAWLGFATLLAERIRRANPGEGR